MLNFINIFIINFVLVITLTLFCSRPKLAPPQNGAEVFVNSIGMEFVKIPKGKFRTKWDEQNLQIEITKDFYLGRTEVTQRQYREVMELVKKEEEIKSKKSKINTRPSYFQKDCLFRFLCDTSNLPIESISWYDAKKFIKMLNEIENNNNNDNPLQYRLPTEAEWEYAYRAGTQTAYYWGDGFDGEYLWWLDIYWEHEEYPIYPGGLKRPNAFGLYDMGGNVMEWCEDYFELPELPKGKNQKKIKRLVDPKTKDSETKAIRGGSWRDKYSHIFLSNHRRFYKPIYFTNDIGFRVIATVVDKK